MTTVRFYYDVVSPYSYLAFEVLFRYQSIWNLNIVLEPFFLGGIMQGSGNVPPGANPAKATYLLKDLSRSQKIYQIKLTVPPAEFPISTIKAMRILTAIQQDFPSFLEKASRRFWEYYWGKGLNIKQDSIIQQLLTDIGLSAPQIKGLFERSTQETIKEALKAKTQEALSLGAFGAPVIMVKDEFFFGSDRFEHIAVLLNKPWLGYVPSKQKL